MLECPEDNELPETVKADRLSTGEATQAPDVKPVGQCSSVIISQGVNVLEHADDRCGYGRPVVAKEEPEDEIGDPLTISQLCRRLLYLPPQSISQISDPQRRKLLTLNGSRIIDAQNLQGLEISYRLARGNPTPKANA